VFDKDHIIEHAFDAPPALAEQAVHCLELVAELSQAGLSYQFKGGNSLLLILDAPRRFSIDVDVATDEPRERIEQCLDRIVAEHGVFTRWDTRAHKTKPWLPIASYYLFFDSHFAEAEQTSIMLDVQLRRSPYRTGMKPVVCGRLFTAPAEVELPYPASIVGDKLLTLGPETLGIPVGKRKEAQRLKHVFDVSLLLGRFPVLDDMRASFMGCLDHENDIQKSTLEAEVVLHDTIGYCACAARHPTPPAVDTVDGALRENVVGLEPFAGHLFAGTYTWQQLQHDTARAALAITATCRSEVDQESFEAALRGGQASDTAVRTTTDLLPCTERVRRWWGWVSAWLGRDPFGG
jgi:hypothetical protein